MIRAIKAVSTERGRDPREFALFAFGGNGPLFACGMAEALGIKRIVVPPSAGLFSSFGLLYADVEHHYGRTFRRLLRKADLGRDRSCVGCARQRGDGAARRSRASPAPAPGCGGRRRCTTTARASSSSCRCPSGRSTRRWWPISRRPSAPSTRGPTAIAPGLRSRSSWSRSRWWARACARAPACPSASGPTPPGARTVGVRGKPISARRTAGWKRRCCGAPTLSAQCKGPLIVEEYDSTTLVPPGATASLDAGGNIVIEMG